VRRDIETCDGAIVEALRRGMIRVDGETGTVLSRDGRVRIGRVNTNGYRQINLLGHLCYTHRIVWAAAHGPAGMAAINHKNANKLDNRLSNLELVTLKRNAQLWTEREHYDHQVLDGYEGAEVGSGEDPVIQEARAMAARGASRREISAFVQTWRAERDGVVLSAAD